MRLLNVRGRLVNKNVERFRIKWDEPSRSKIQFAVKQFLKPYWLGHVVYEEFPVFGSRLKVDIINFTRKIAIEVHGDQHFKFNSHFHGTRENWLSSNKRDSDKLSWLSLNDIFVVEILQNEAHNVSEKFFLEKFNITLP